MASFFSDLGKTFQNAAKSIQKKTAEGMEASRRNSELRALREEQKRLFATLGEAYYTSRQDGGGQEQLGLLVRRLDELEERLAAVSAELDALNDKKRCPECGLAVSIDTRFCPSCGAKMPEPQPPQPETEQEVPRAEYCKNCGALRQGNARFCSICGQPFVIPEVPKEAAVPKPEVQINWPGAGMEEAAAEEPPLEEVSAEEAPGGAPSQDGGGQL